MSPRKKQQHLTLDLPQAKPGCVWMHACSVGEVASMIPLLSALHQQGHSLHLTVITATGFAHAQQHLSCIASVSFLPWDLPGLMRRWVKHMQPALLLLAETEFWPGMLGACQRRNIPVIGINTRISDRSFPRYKASHFFWRRYLKPVALFLAQSDTDAERLRQIGVERARIQTVGNLKYATSTPDVDATALRQTLDPTQTRPILVLASSHDDEEMRVLRMFNNWRSYCPELLLLIIPRHPQRFDIVAQSVAASGTPLWRWSQRDESPHAGSDVVLIDAMGILQQFYTIADVVIIGGSLVPVGGHNPLEAAVCGRGVITGPHVQNFRAIMQDMCRNGAAVVCESDPALEQAVTRMLHHPDELQALHAHALSMMQDQHRVLDRVLAAIAPWLAPASNTPSEQTTAQRHD